MDMWLLWTFRTVCYAFSIIWESLLIKAEVLTHILSHLPPQSLSDISLVSRRFHSLVTTPHAWRIAFSRFFSGLDALEALVHAPEISDNGSDILRSERRLFTRLTALASWRSEYILRTRLLRSLARGKPADFEGPGNSVPSRSGSGHSGNAQMTYNSNMLTTVNHLHATFGTGVNKRLPRFIHGADEVGSACLSDPKAGKVDQWGFSDPQGFSQFADRFPGDAQYGLGAGDVVGIPNNMDVSQPYGMVYGEGSPGGMMYFRSTEEKRGRLLTCAFNRSLPELGIPNLASQETTCSLWIAKSSGIPDISEGLIGILSGSSNGVLTSYSLGTNGLGKRRLERGEITARWVLSPGVPIVAIYVDEQFTARRHGSRRIWAVVLNALGEIFYVTDLLARRAKDRPTPKRPSAKHTEQLAWEMGRSIYWALVEPTRRTARPDPFGTSDVDRSYSPRSSWVGMGLSKEQLAAETREIENFMAKKPKHFRSMCEGWDMRRRLEVDFAASDENGAGENIVVISCGLDEGQSAGIKRFTRCRVKGSSDGSIGTGEAAVHVEDTKDQSVFGDSSPGTLSTETWSFQNVMPVRRSSAADTDFTLGKSHVEEWRTSTLLFGELKFPQITTTAIDGSSFAVLTTLEDPLLCASGSSVASSPFSSPAGKALSPITLSDIPGQRARFLAVGTTTGIIILWDVRAPISSNSAFETAVKPVRMICTDSPQISCLGLSALYLVHGGNDGLVQAWDPLAATTEPIRTLNSRFSSRARRRLVQAEASPQGVGINLFAAGAICLDPDPTVLRGMVSLGTHLRYWSYSSAAADQYKGTKRRLRRSERGSNQGADKFSGTGRTALKDYIANEKIELERQKLNRTMEEQRLAGRFGLDLLGPGASEDEILAYATLLSEEAAASDEQRRNSGSVSSAVGNTDRSSNETVTEDIMPAAFQEQDIDADIAEAIRLSLLQETENPLASGSSAAGFRSNNDFPIKYAKSRKSPPRSPAKAQTIAPIPEADADDLDFALQLSLTEEKSKADVARKRKGRFD